MDYEPPFRADLFDIATNRWVAGVYVVAAMLWMALGWQWGLVSVGGAIVCVILATVVARRVMAGRRMHPDEWEKSQRRPPQRRGGRNR